jgi:TolB protein
MDRSGARHSLPHPTRSANAILIWLPDSVHLMHVTVGTGQSDTYLLNTFSGEVFNFTESAGIRGLPAWSPDGRHVAYVRYASVLSHSARSADTTPVWSRDGALIAFVSLRDGLPQLYVMNADGSQQRRITHFREGVDFSPVVWMP